MNCRQYGVSNMWKPDIRPNNQKRVLCSVCGILVIDQKQLAQYMHSCTRHANSRDAPITFKVDTSGTSTCVQSKRVETSSAISLTATKSTGPPGFSVT